MRSLQVSITLPGPHSSETDPLKKTWKQRFLCENAEVGKSGKTQRQWRNVALQ